ncbi:MAG: NUDIX hydrolase [Chryseobacterium sp.]|nr:MAG: NUDIX hydrolase [Chryseobacterium sp.]
MRQSETDILKHADRYLHNVAVDNVIFGYHDKALKVLLQQPKNLDKWTVTGGYIERGESIEQAATRVAVLRTGLEDLFLQQFRSFGNPTRILDPSFNPESILKLTGVDIPKNFWIFDYFVSIGFYTLTEFSKVEIQMGPFDKSCQWWPVSELPPLMFDHNMIILEALKSIRLHIAHSPIGYELLPEKFTLPEIYNLYITILGKPLDERNFSKRLLAAGIIVKLDERRKIGAHRSPFLYKFDKQKYDECLKTGVQLAF